MASGEPAQQRERYQQLSDERHPDDERHEGKVGPGGRTVVEVRVKRPSLSLPFVDQAVCRPVKVALEPVQRRFRPGHPMVTPRP